MILLYILCAFFALASVLLLVLFISAAGRAERLKAVADTAENRLTEEGRRRERELAALADELREKSRAVTDLSSARSALEVQVRTLTDQIERDRAELEKIQASFRLEFRNMANEMLEEKSKQFRSTNKEAMDALLTPFRTSIVEFRERVEKIYSEENRDRGVLQSEIKNLLELNRKITEETTNLTNALKGNSKVQGDWGEMILQTILESSHLVGGIHYTVQENLKDEAGNNLRPDVILNLPDNKRIVIDSKVSLTAYVNYCSEEQEVTRSVLLREHVDSVRRHVSELGNKSYQNLLDSPDFVIMFVPNEPAFMCALQNDPAIWSDAYRKKVIVSSPTNLFALLKIVDDLWKRDSQGKNALRIAEEGGRMYDKLVGFTETLEAIGKSIGNAQAGYEKAIRQLATGSGNLIKKGEQMKKLGAKASKEFSSAILTSAEIGEPEDDKEVLALEDTGDIQKDGTQVSTDLPS